MSKLQSATACHDGPPPTNAALTIRTVCFYSELPNGEDQPINVRATATIRIGLGGRRVNCRPQEHTTEWGFRNKILSVIKPTQNGQNPESPESPLRGVGPTWLKESSHVARPHVDGPGMSVRPHLFSCWESGNCADVMSR